MAAKKKKVSLKEFRAWLQGVEELQPNDWCPSAPQWKLIRAKIDHIVEEKAPLSVVAQVPVSPQYPPQMFSPPPQMPGVPNLPEAEMSGSAKQMLSGSNNAGGKSITPNIDTTDGNYNSSFD